MENGSRKKKYRHAFSEKTLALLRKVGWHESWEAIHFSEYQKILTEE